MARSLPDVIPRPADIDIDILREMYRSRGVTIAGVDPRLKASRIAQRLNVSRARVDSRLKEWMRYGLLQRFDVWPNPALFDLVGFTLDVRLSDRFHKQDLIDRLRLVDGVVGGMEFVGDWMGAQFVVPNEAEAHRRASLVRGLAGVAEVGSPILWARLEPARTLTPLDLRIVRVLRQYPTQPLSVIARHVGVSTRTITTRYGRLVEDLAVWFVPVLDFRALSQPVVSINIRLSDAADHEFLSKAFRKAYPQSLEFVRTGFGPVLPRNVAVFFALIPSAARVEELEGFLRGLPGVQEVESLLMVRIFSFPETFDRLIPPAVVHRSSSSPDPEGTGKPSRPSSGRS
ncbi:MAG TPA: winged helix-turn-helix transcriptional regulator [Thermoplasmata archaeon]|nr:winged helix-turn-helix transcriptional regulator [Thermoplasmata archaeon]